MSLKTIKYFPTAIVAVTAVSARWWVWDYYIQLPQTHDGEVRAEQVSITSQASGGTSELYIKDDQFMGKGDVPFTIDRTSFRTVELNTQAQLTKAQSDLVKANDEANRRRYLSQNYTSAEDLDIANLDVRVMQVNAKAAEASSRQAQWRLTRTMVEAPVADRVTNLPIHAGDYVLASKPLFALVDSHSFCMIGYFEEIRLRHIREGASATVILYSNNVKLQGRVSSTGRAIYDRSVGGDSGLILDIRPNVPRMRLAQRVPVRIEFDAPPWGITLVSDITCGMSIGQHK